MPINSMKRSDIVTKVFVIHTNDLNDANSISNFSSHSLVSLVFNIS
jgi:hypothetical protein